MTSHDMLSELRQTRPFAIREEELFLSLVRTADLLGRALSTQLKAHGISSPQYNALRILRGAGEPGLPCGEIAARMVTRDPDVTRLLDRLQQRGLIARGRGADDRRVVSTRITPEGLALLEALDEPIRETHRRQLGFLSAPEMESLLSYLTRVREQQDTEVNASAPASA
ncbi:MAG TPA: MarR family transcriptional regulator [Fibrobacteria bacterium]|nr:MarR family transcriptional regulator [Fibrobacteria bacterium]